MESFGRNSKTVNVQMPLTEFPKKSRFFQNCEVRRFYKSIFDEYDKNKDGLISLDELDDLIAENEKVKLGKQSLKYVQSNFDRDQNNYLDFDEFFAMINHEEFKFTFKKVTARYLKFLDTSKSSQTITLKRQLTDTGTYEEQYKCTWQQTFMIIISVIQIMLHYINQRFIDNNKEGPIVNALKFEPNKKTEIYRFFTYALVHNQKNHLHLYINVIMQIVAGIPLEMVHGWRIIILYVVGAVGGSLTHYVIEIGEETGLVGSSACVCSFFTAHIVIVLLNWKQIIHPLFNLMVYLIFVSLSVIYEVLDAFLFKNSSTISYGAHLGGALVGLFLSPILLRNLTVTKKERIASYIFVTMFIIYISTMIILTISDNHLRNVVP